MLGVGNRRVALFAFAIVALAAGGSACAGILGIEDGVLESSEGGTDATTDSQPGTDAGHDAPASDAPQGDASGCEARTVDDATGIYVTLYGADNASCGTRASPCLTVQQGIAQAQLLQRSTVYIARGTYTESVTVGSGITLEGAWDTVNSSWVPICGTDELSAVALAMPSTANVVVTAVSGATGVGLRYLSVLGNPAAPPPGQSLYGVFASNASVTLDSVIVTMGNASDGTGGDAGTSGHTGLGTCPGSTGAAGTSAGDAPPTVPGTFGPSGYAASGGQTGSPDGGFGSSGTCSVGCITQCTTCAEACMAPAAGCGGFPGTGGAGGQGGGSSIAVYGWNAQITVIGGALTAGNGGSGGNGGDGGPGGPGAAYVQGLQATCLSLCSDAGCASVGDTAAEIASNGGPGGAGGHGGGGAGGWSYAIYAGGDAGTVVLQGSPALAHGTGGEGGIVNGAPGQASNQGP